MNTLFSLTQYALKELKDTYDKKEIQSICKLIFSDVFHFTNIEIHLKKQEILNKTFTDTFLSIVAELKTGKPIQYIIGSTDFYGLKFNLDNSTLIPRPETEELVEWIKEYLQAGQTVLDIGTGSGCIAITLASILPDLKIEGVDINPLAIQKAKENAIENQVEVNFQIRDILNYRHYKWEYYDIIVSNPPYIRESEKALMKQNVLEHEPYQALFISDNDPLLFYRQIAAFGKEYLKENGWLFFEINEAFGQDMVKLLEQSGYKNVTLKKDIFEKDRFIKAELKER